MSTPTFIIFFENHYTLFGALSLKDLRVYYSASDVAKILNSTWSSDDLHGFPDLREILMPEEPLPHAPCRLIEESRLFTFLSSYTEGPGKDLYHFLTRGPMEYILKIETIHHLLEKANETDTLFSEWIERLRKEHDPSWKNPSVLKDPETLSVLPVPRYVPPKPGEGSMCGYTFYSFPYS